MLGLAQLSSQDVLSDPWEFPGPQLGFPLHASFGQLRRSLGVLTLTNRLIQDNTVYLLGLKLESIYFRRKKESFLNAAKP